MPHGGMDSPVSDIFGYDDMYSDIFQAFPYVFMLSYFQFYCNRFICKKERFLYIFHKNVLFRTDGWFAVFFSLIKYVISDYDPRYNTVVRPEKQTVQRNISVEHFLRRPHTFFVDPRLKPVFVPPAGNR